MPSLPSDEGEAESREETIARSEPRNLLLLVLHQIVVRTGWIFKTESVIMPAFLDYVMPAGWLRGLITGCDCASHRPIRIFPGHDGCRSHYTTVTRKTSRRMTREQETRPFLMLTGLQAIIACGAWSGPVQTQMQDGWPGSAPARPHSTHPR